MMLAIISLIKPAVEITVIAVIFYLFYSFFEGTRALQVLRGIILLAIAFLFARLFDLQSINWLLEKVFALSLIGFFILFQPELRRGLATIGGHHFFSTHELKEQNIYELAKAARALSEKGYGAIIAIERLTGLRSYIATGLPMDSFVSSELIVSLFTPGNPLHDGGIVISDNRISAAACLFPLTQKTSLSASLGTRHRAALGLSEESDSIVIVVSEETSKISIAENGMLVTDLDENSLLEYLKKKEISPRLPAPNHLVKKISYIKTKLVGKNASSRVK